MDAKRDAASVVWTTCMLTTFPGGQKDFLNAASVHSREGLVLL